MPGKVKCKIIAARNLPIMDRGSDTTDAYVEIKLGNATYKTEVCRKSLNPTWNSDWYRFEVDDAELQDEPLQIRVMDYDMYSANDAIGKVYISLSPLLLPNSDTTTQTSHTSKGSIMSGWIPIYDTMQGVRGEVHLIVKIDLFSDVNKFRQSSCGVQFFHSPNIPYGYYAQAINGFVEELVVNDDPEYQWIDKIRTPRASNEARQIAFIKLSGQVQRKIGIKAIDMGANAVIGYTQCFDLEGDVGVVARGIGTAVTLVKIHDTTSQQPPPTTLDTTLLEENESLSISPNSTSRCHTRTESTGANKLSQSPAKLNCGTPGSIIVNFAKDMGICRRSSDSDLSITPKGNSLTSGEQRTTGLVRLPAQNINVKPAYNEQIEMLEYPFLTMSKFPAGFILQLGAAVAARSVKLLERIPNPDEPDSRDTWWNEIRMEIRSHARTVGCNVILGYTEMTAISEDVCVLSATGTAALINQNYTADISGLDITTSVKVNGTNTNKEIMTSSLDRQEFEMNGKPNGTQTVHKEKSNDSDTELASSSGATNSAVASNVIVPVTHPLNNQSTPTNCTICHIPYTQKSVPFRVNMLKCAVCKRGKVADVLLATIEMPEGMQVIGRGCLLQAQVCRPKRDLKGESNAKEISDGLPFLEYELHRLLIGKLKVKGMNAIFGLKTNISIGERMMALIATGTAVYLAALPSPLVPKIVAGNSGNWTDNERLIELQKSIQDTFERNREIYQLKVIPDREMNAKMTEDSDDTDDELNDLDLTMGNKEACILEIDDYEDLDVASSLTESCPPEGFHVVNTQAVPGLYDLEAVRNLQMFTQVWRAKLPMNQPNSTFSKNFNRLLQTIYFKLRTMIPCAICDLRFKLDLPETDEIQLLVTGMALGLCETNKMSKFKRKIIIPVNKDAIKRTDEELIFNLEEDHNNEPSTSSPSPLVQSGSLKIRRKSPPRSRLGSGRFPRHTPIRENRYGVDLTPLSYVPGGKIEKYYGNLNFFFIRESTSVRENGGISGFVHSFITEVLAVVRAHITALGGNAMVAFYMTELVLIDNVHKNQAQCLVSVGGDVVFVSYFNGE
uniref:Putative ca2+-dependent phospholipid-binding protein n=1 Tax=Corethrella appendiculata TaxID=1370023 RepID=U5EQC8_9DIPT